MTLSGENEALIALSNPALIDVRIEGCDWCLTDSDLSRLLDAARADGFKRGQVSPPVYGWTETIARAEESGGAPRSIRRGVNDVRA